MAIFGGISTRASAFSRNILSSAAIISDIARPASATSDFERYSSSLPRRSVIDFACPLSFQPALRLLPELWRAAARAIPDCGNRKLPVIVHGVAMVTSDPILLGLWG